MRERELNQESRIAGNLLTQEWTPTDVLRIWQGERTPKSYREGMQRIANAHNAELVDERQRREQVELKLQAQEHRITDEVESLNQQLLSALAAIEEHRAFLELYFLKGSLRFPDEKDYRQAARDLFFLKHDLSALHEHDAKVRKPLVEGLKRIENANNGHDLAMCQAIARDTLENVKEWLPKHVLD